jgi:hypothetical protein
MRPTRFCQIPGTFVPLRLFFVQEKHLIADRVWWSACRVVRRELKRKYSAAKLQSCDTILQSATRIEKGEDRLRSRYFDTSEIPNRFGCALFRSVHRHNLRLVKNE